MGGSSARLVDVGTQLCGTYRAVRIVNKKKSFINGGSCETPAVNSNDGWLTFARTAIVISFLRTVIQNIALRCKKSKQSFVERRAVLKSFKYQ